MRFTLVLSLSRGTRWGADSRANDNPGFEVPIGNLLVKYVVSLSGAWSTGSIRAYYCQVNGFLL